MVVEANHVETRFQTAVCAVYGTNQVAAAADHGIRAKVGPVLGVVVVLLPFHQRATQSGARDIERQAPEYQ